MRNADFEFAADSVVQVQSHFKKCRIRLGDDAELIIDEQGLLNECEISGRGVVVVHGKVIQNGSRGILYPKRVVVGTGGCIIGTVHQGPEPTEFAFEPGSILRLDITAPTS